jgi:hypothetical protein
MVPLASEIFLSGIEGKKCKFFFKESACIRTKNIECKPHNVKLLNPSKSTLKRRLAQLPGVAPIEEKLIQHRLRWFVHVQRRFPEAPVRNGVLKRADNVKSGRGRPKLTWDESVKRDLKEWNISKDLVMDRSAWRLAINVPEP